VVRYRHNEFVLQSEVVAAILRCEQKKVRATVGQVGSHLISIRASRVVIVRTLDDLWHWGLINKDEFSYRPNVKSHAYSVETSGTGIALVAAMIAHNDNLASYFPEFTNTQHEANNHDVR